MRRTFQVSVNRDVMKWARESAGLDAEAVAKRLGISLNTVEGWELGTKKPTLKALNELASFYKRPLATFFLPEPPQELPLPKDFRVLPEEQKRPLSRKARLAIRRARRVQSLATELTKAADREPSANIERADLIEDPEVVAARERDRLAITVREQLNWKNDYVAFSMWREAVEGMNIAVLQVSIPVEEARGFSLLDNLLPAIVVSARDYIRARMFTLFHEYAHLLLGTSGICIPNEASHDDAHLEGIERFCNHFAGALLVPKNALQMDEDVRLITRRSDVDDYCIDRIAGRFKVSRQVVLRRMLISELILKHQYESKLEEWETRLKPKPKKRVFVSPPPKRCMLENGHLFVSLALGAREREVITYSDLADYLSINLKHLDKVEVLLSEHK